LQGQEETENISSAISFPYPLQFSLGPEIYHVKRVREGGTRQTGTLTGLRANFDRIQRYKIYWGSEALYARGMLNGRSGSGAKLRSTFIDASLEGRVGYTFQHKSALRPSFTPFIGYGYYREINKYHPPSPIHVKFRTEFHYIPCGFLSSLTICPQWELGLNFKAMAMWEACCKVMDDPEFDDRTMLVEDKVNYRVELPVKYRLPYLKGHFEIGLVPFYETRHYGGRVNYPFDFLDTKLTLYGCNLQLIYAF
jgi:hypothetical protein